MDTLILSCSTGGGHNSAGAAVKEELERRGHNVTMIDPYELVSTRLENTVGNGYIKMAQKTPHLFGFVYRLGDWYRRLPIHSPVYAVNKAMLKKMKHYLDAHTYDVILMPHVYPGEILTYMKNRGLTIPKLVFIATDYACIPFTEETNCDYYAIPCVEMAADFTSHKIPAEKLVPTGIPVKACFQNLPEKEEAKRLLSLHPDTHYLLLSGGSIGAGSIQKAVRILMQYLKDKKNYHLIVICGNNQKLYRHLVKKYGTNTAVTILTKTNQMALYMRAADVYLSKPGGLSSTEACVSGTPLIHIAPIPGCETKNMAFFKEKGLSLAIGDDLKALPDAIQALSDPHISSQMLQRQQTVIPQTAAASICDLVERITTDA